MEIDKTTLADLSVFDAEEGVSVFSKLDFCQTIGGKEQLYLNFSKPLSTIEEIESVQRTLKTISKNQHLWPLQITNGTIMVVKKFYQTTFDEIPARPSSISAYSYKLFHPADFSLVKYSVEHCFDLIKGMQLFICHFLKEDAPQPLKNVLLQAQKIVDKPQFSVVEKNENTSALSIAQRLQLANFIRYHYKQNILQLLHIYFQLDAWNSMAKAVNECGLVFPEFIKSDKPLMNVKGLYHILLPDSVAYDVSLDPESNFLFLTGANMAGKSTFIRSVGAAVFLAHIGMGVPAQQLRLSLFDGLLSNINVLDNIAKGESFFYNEVQRIKATIAKVANGRKWLVLIDELFKGTNVEDAMKCSLAVIEGLLKIKGSFFILSTHLYEIGETLKQHPNIRFNYFETTVADGQLHFSYQLKQGISDDRLGYLILKKEGVVEMLKKL